jgi:hypothetical protein
MMRIVFECDDTPENRRSASRLFDNVMERGNLPVTRSLGGKPDENGQFGEGGDVYEMQKVNSEINVFTMRIEQRDQRVHDADRTVSSLADLVMLAASAMGSVMDSARPSDDKVACPMCLEFATRAKDHQPDCAYRIARTQISPADLKRLRSFVRMLEEA